MIGLFFEVQTRPGHRDQYLDLAASLKPALEATGGCLSIERFRSLTREDLLSLRGLNESVSLDELAEVYLPLSRLLNLHVRAARNLNGVSDTFLGIFRDFTRI